MIDPNVKRGYEKRLHSMREKKAGLQAENENLQQKLADVTNALSDEVMRLRAENERYMTAFAETNEHNTRLQAENEALEADKSALQAAAEYQISLLREEVDAKTRTVAALLGGVEKLRARLERACPMCNPDGKKIKLILGGGDK